MVTNNVVGPFRSWFFASVTAALVGAGVIYGFFHFGMGIPLAKLWQPYATQSAATLILGPFLYVARRKQAASGGTQVGLYFWAIGPYCFLVISAWVFYGTRAGLIPIADLTTSYITLAIFCSLVPTAAYYMHKWIRL